MNIRFEAVMPYVPYILKGVVVTLQIAFVGALFGTIIGLILSFITSKENMLSYFLRFVIDFFRGTPLLFQLVLFHYGIAQVMRGFVPHVFASALIVFSLNSAAYLSEVLRAGIAAIDKGQIEAATSLGISKKDIALHITLPIAIKNVLPAIVNEFITLTKETSVVSFIGVSELMRRYEIVSGTIFRSLEPLIVVGIIYYLMNKILSVGGKRIERKLNYDQR